MSAKSNVGSRKWVYHQARVLRTALRARKIPESAGVVGLIQAMTNESELCGAIDQSIIEVQKARLDMLEFIAEADVTLYPHQLRLILGYNTLGHQKVSI